MIIIIITNERGRESKTRQKRKDNLANCNFPSFACDFYRFDKAHQHHQLIIMTINIKLIQVSLFHTLDTHTHTRTHAHTRMLVVTFSNTSNVSLSLLLLLSLLFYMRAYVMKIKNFIVSFYSSNFPHFETRNTEHQKIKYYTRNSFQLIVLDQMNAKMRNFFCFNRFRL